MQRHYFFIYVCKLLDNQFFYIHFPATSIFQQNILFINLYTGVY